jgi:hypothetical protein
MPKAYNGRNRTFFFGYEGVKVRRAVNFIVPCRPTRKAKFFANSKRAGPAKSPFTNVHDAARGSGFSATRLRAT